MVGRMTVLSLFWRKGMKKFTGIFLFVLVAMVLAFSIGCKNDSTSVDPNKEKFIGTWESVLGDGNIKMDSNSFTMNNTELSSPVSGTWTVSADGKTATTSKVSIPNPDTGSVQFSLTLPEPDVLFLGPANSQDSDGETPAVFGKKTTTTPDLTGTWSGKVVSVGDAEGTIKFTKDEEGKLSAELTISDDEPFASSSQVAPDGNFFTIEWNGEPQNILGPFHGLVSTSGKAYLDDGAVFTKQ